MNNKIKCFAAVAVFSMSMLCLPSMATLQTLAVRTEMRPGLCEIVPKRAIKNRQFKVNERWEKLQSIKLTSSSTTDAEFDASSETIVVGEQDTRDESPAPNKEKDSNESISQDKILAQPIEENIPFALEFVFI